MYVYWKSEKAKRNEFKYNYEAIECKRTFNKLETYYI